MSRHPWAIALAALILFTSTWPTRAVSAEENSYASRLATARALAAEGSHAAARDRYAEALAMTDDAEQKRWTQLWLLAEDLSADRSKSNGPRVASELAALLAPYGKPGAVRDRFWAAAKSVEADTHWPSTPEALQLRLEVASFWASQPASPENEAPFLEAAMLLGRTLATGYRDKTNAPLADSFALLRQATSGPPPPAGRGKLSLLLAQAMEHQRRLLKNSAALISAAYEAAVTATRGMPDHGEALLRRAQWELRLNLSSRLSGQPGETPGRVPASEFARRLGLIDEALSFVANASLDRELRTLVTDLGHRRDGLVNPSLQIDTAESYLPESRFAFGVIAQHVEEIVFELHRVDLAVVREISFAKPNAGLPPTLQRAKPLYTWNVVTGLGREMGLVRAHYSRTEALAPGAYVLIARPTGIRSSEPVARPFLVTNAQAIAQSGSSEAVDIYAFRQETGELLPNVRGQLWRGEESTKLNARATGHASGIPPVVKKNAGFVTVLGEADGQPFFIRSFYPKTPVRDDHWLVHLLADRPLYQPGETAQWKLTLRHRVNGALRVPVGERLKVVARIGDEPPLGSWDVTLNSLGNASGKVSIPALTAPGQVSFEVTKTGKEKFEEHIDAFAIDHFRAPESSLTITPADPEEMKRAQPGSDVELKIAARYFSGEPLAEANVNVGIRFVPRFSWFAFRERDDERQVPEPMTLTVVTDVRGEARLRVPVPLDLPREVGMHVQAGLAAAGTVSRTDFQFEILPGGYTAEIAPAAQREATPTARVNLTGDGGPQLLYLAPDAAAELAVFTRDGRAAPVATRGHLAISKQTWEEIWRAPTGELLTGEVLRARRGSAATWPPREAAASGAWQLIHSGYRTEAVGASEVATDSTGRAVAKIPALAAGYYEVNYEPEIPAADGLPLAKVNLVVANAGTSWLDYHTSVPRVVPCLDQQEPGKPIRAVVVLPVEARHALVHVQGAGDGETRVEIFAGNTRLVEFPWKPAYDSGARIDVAVLATEVEPSGGTQLQISRAPHQAIVTVSPETADAQPGAKSRLRIQATDATGRPLASELALTVADAAVAALVSPRARSIEDTFLEPVSLSAPSLTHTPTAVFHGAALPAQGAKGSIVVTTGESLSEDMVLLSPFQVESAGDRGYRASATLAGSRFAVPGAPVAAAESRVRSSFSYTAFWVPDVKTDRKGEATVEFTYPDNLTAWQITAEAVAEGNRFGTASATTRTSLPLQARLRLPRALVAGDSASLLGVVLNQTATPVAVRAELTGQNASALELVGPTTQNATAPAGGETTLRWPVRAKAPGQSSLRFAALGEKIGDAMETRLLVQEDGFFQTTGVTGRAHEQPLRVTVNLPAPLDRERTQVELQVSPGITPSLVQAMPYLIDYPYGCVEQTVSRFLPAAVVGKLLRDLGFTAAEVEAHLLPATLPGPPARTAAAGLGKLQAVITQSLVRLQEASGGDGEFGWFPGGGPDAYMTAYVLRGLNVAAAAGIALPGELHRDTHAATLRALAQDDPNQSPQKLAWVLSAAVGYPEPPDAKQKEMLLKVFSQLYAERAALGPAGLALLAQTAQTLDRPAESAILRGNLNDGVTRATSTEFGQTAHWGKTSDYYDGLEGAVESTALCLQALLALDPKDGLVDAAAAWLLLNRQSGRWHNTRDTALAVLALHDYARARGETSPRGGYRLLLNGRVLAEKRFDRASLLAPATFVAESADLQPGPNSIVLERTGAGSPCYLVATTRGWAQAESTRPAGSFLRVTREFSRISETNTVIGLAANVTKPLPATGGAVLDRELVECRLILEVPHDLDYVIVESPKPGGCEPLNPLSGWDATLRRDRLRPEESAGRPNAPDQGAPLYREEHDDRSVFFLPHVAAGRWEISYKLRALFPGDFRVLPASSAAIYVPVISANTDARRLTIQERPRP